MSYPPLIKESEPTPMGWQRRVRDAVNGLLQRTSGVGSTADRVRNPTTGTQYFDETLGIPIYWNGTDWIDATGATV